MGRHHHQHDQNLDYVYLSSGKGMRALQVSFLGLIATALLQFVVFFYSGSAALLADTLHNFVDAFTAVPLWLAFLISRRKPDRKFTYGYSRLEDLSGFFIILVIFGTAGFVGYDSIRKIQEGFVPTHLKWVLGASVIGYLGNELVARYRIKIGKDINSAALVADGHHARADAYTSLGVILGVIGVYLGFPMADPLVGFIIAVAILHIGWTSGKEMMVRLVDAIDPQLVDRVSKEAEKVAGVIDVMDVRARQVGHELRIDLTIEVKNNITVLQGHEIAINVHRALKEKFPEIVSPNIHVDPEGHRGEKHHFAPHHK